MIDIIINKNQCKLQGTELTTSLLQTLDRELSYEINGARFMPAFNRGWDGRKHFFNNKLIFPRGCLNRVINIFKSYDLEYNIIDNNIILKSEPLDISEKLKSIKKIPYDYQVEAVKTICDNNYGIVRAATGSGKCSDIDSYHITEDGILSYRDLLSNNELKIGECIFFEKILSTPLSENNIDKSSHIYYDGYGESFYLKTDYGFEIKATPEHKIKILSNNGEVCWKKMEDIEIGDYSIINYGTNLFGKQKINLDDAYWYGLLIGDGGLHSDNHVGFYNEDNHILDFVYKYIEKNKFNNVNIYENKRGKSKTYRAIQIGSTKYRNELKKIGFKKSLSINKTIPEFIRKSDKESLAMFLRGIYETDGWVEDKPALCLALSCKEIIDQIHLILLNFGIISSHRVKKTTHEDSHILTIYREYIPIFIKEIGLDPNGHKFAKLNKYIEKFSTKKENTNTNIIPNQHLKIKQLYNIFKKFFQNENAPLKMNTVRSWCDNEYWRIPSKNKLIIFIEWCKSLTLKLNDTLKNDAIKIINEIAYVCNQNFFFDKVKFKQKIMSENYDFVIPKTHSFISQGFINHNTMIMALTTAQLNKSTVVYVIGLSLLYQTYDLFVSIFGEDHVGIVGDGNCNIKTGDTDINIVSVWTVGLALGIDKKKIINDDEDIVEKTADKSKHQQIRELISTAKIHVIDECHVCGCDTLLEINKTMNPEYVFGFSASPYSDDGSDLVIESILGSIIVNISASYLIERGYLAQPIIKFIKIPKVMYSKDVKYPTIYKEYIIENDIRNNMVVQNTKDLVEKGYKVLVLYKNISHGKILLDKLKNEVSCVLLNGKDNNDIRDEAKIKMENGQIDCVIASNIFDIGLDWPILSGLVCAGSGKSSIRSLQRIGRVIRKYDKKTFACVVEFADDARYLREHTLARKKVYETEPKFKIIWLQKK